MTRVEELERLIRPLGSAVVAFSGGVDSSLVAALAARALGERALAVTAVSPALATGELDGARIVAEAVGIAHETISTDELAREDYRRNDENRCYHCKTELYDRLLTIAEDRGYGAVLSGANGDDLGDWRPGLRAAAEHGVRHPLLEAGIGKDEVRALARELGIPSAEKPASPCLASRLPYGTPVTPEALAQVDRAEQALKRLGYRVLRVRHYGDLGRVELAEDELERALADAEPVIAAVIASGYARAQIDVKPFRSGSLSRMLFAPRLTVDGAAKPRLPQRGSTSKTRKAGNAGLGFDLGGPLPPTFTKVGLMGEGKLHTSDYLRTIGVPELAPRTSPFDPGYDPVTLEAHLEQSSHLISLLKISMATWLVANENATRRKLASASRCGVPTTTGGGPFEVAVAQGRLPEYLDLCADVGVTRIECGEGFTKLDLRPSEVVAQAQERGLEVQFELGKKHEGAMTSDVVEALIEQGRAWLDAGVRQLVVEARESAQGVGLFDDAGDLNRAFADRFADEFGLETVMFEAPNKPSQFALLDHFGREVHLCNVRLEELLRVEIYRRGLHSDAFGKPNLRPAAPVEAVEHRE